MKNYFKAIWAIFTEWSGFQGDIKEIWIGITAFSRLLGILAFRLLLILFFPLTAFVVMYVNKKNKEWEDRQHTRLREEIHQNGRVTYDDDDV